MRRIRWTLPLALLTTCGISAAQGPATPLKSTVTNDLVYKQVDGQELTLDIARPADGEGSAPFPAVVVIHGGAWRTGDKKDNRTLLAEFAARGYVAISPQYRFYPKDVFPAQVHDVKASVRWLKAHAKDYRIDPDRVGAIGFSAGGHLSLMLGVTGPDDGLEGTIPDDRKDVDTKIRAVVNYFGPVDLAAPDIPFLSQGLVRDFLGGTAIQKPEAAKRASPITYLDRKDPPILTFQGTKDPLVPHSQATKLSDAMTVQGIRGRTELLIGLGHGWKGGEFRRTMDEAYRFLDTHLK